mmetsp:Transcript_26708/g.41095  ORF Transcript_26708/g.41095 Transcript_26708/m.41095 type:complete len:106 (+) Transcript_26708:197-514(+)
MDFLSRFFGLYIQDAFIVGRFITGGWSGDASLAGLARTAVGPMGPSEFEVRFGLGDLLPIMDGIFFTGGGGLFRTRSLPRTAGDESGGVDETELSDCGGLVSCVC